jgi:hypothetical protein
MEMARVPDKAEEDGAVISGDTGNTVTLISHACAPPFRMLFLQSKCL